MSSKTDKAFIFFSFLFLCPMDQDLEKKKLKFFVLNILFLIFSLICSYIAYPIEFKISILYTIGVLQTYFFGLVAFFLAADFYARQKGVFETFSIKMKKFFILSLLLLVIVRLTKLSLIEKNFHGISFTCSTMTSELVMSANDFLYAFCLLDLKDEVESIFKKIKDDKDNDLRKLAIFEDKLMKIVVDSKKLISFFSTRLFVTLTLNYFQLVVSLFWIFVRIIRHMLKNPAEFSSVFYLIQPFFCFAVVFYASNSFSNQVTIFFKRFLVLNHVTWIFRLLK